MERVESLMLQVQPLEDDDDEEVAELTQRLRVLLLDLDLDSVDSVAGSSPADGAKGLETFVGWLVVRLGKEGLQAVVGVVVGWATRAGHSVEITCDGETLKVSAATSAQQERIINDFFARHAPRG